MGVKTKPKVAAVVPYFGSSRIIADKVGEALRGCSWVGVPFAGGMCEIAAIDARTIVVSDLHRHVINLAMVIAEEGYTLRARLRDVIFHQDLLAMAQAECRRMEDQMVLPDFDAAMAYYIASWMGRNGKAGIDDEFNGRLSIRWNANGGDSAVRFRNAVESIEAWQQIMRRCTFDVLDAFDFLARCEDTAGHGLYIDAPWPDDGDRYKHSFTTDQQRQLAGALSRFKKTRVVIRYGVHPLIQELYPRDRWTWNEIDGRTQANKAKCEVLITNVVSRSLF